MHQQTNDSFDNRLSGIASVLGQLTDELQSLDADRKAEKKAALAAAEEQLAEDMRIQKNAAFEARCAEADKVREAYMARVIAAKSPALRGDEAVACDHLLRRISRANPRDSELQLANAYDRIISAAATRFTVEREMIGIEREIASVRSECRQLGQQIQETELREALKAVDDFRLAAAQGASCCGEITRDIAYQEMDTSKPAKKKAPARKVAKKKAKR